MAKGDDWVEPCGSDGRIDAEDYADSHRNSERKDKAAPGHDGRHGREGGDGKWNQKSQPDTDKATERGKDEGLDQKLHDNLAPSGTDGPSDSDFTGSFSDARKHDIHDSDTTDKERDSGNGTQYDGKSPLCSFRLAKKCQRDIDLVVFPLMERFQHSGYSLSGCFDVFFTIYANNDLVKFDQFSGDGAVCMIERQISKALSDGRQGNIGIGLAVEGLTLTFAGIFVFDDTDDFERLSIDSHRTADCVGFAEQSTGSVFGQNGNIGMLVQILLAETAAGNQFARNNIEPLFGCPDDPQIERSFRIAARFLNGFCRNDSLDGWKGSLKTKNILVEKSVNTKIQVASTRVFIGWLLGLQQDILGTEFSDLVDGFLAGPLRLRAWQ